VIVRVDVRALEVGESVTVPVNEPIALQVDDQRVDAPASGSLRVDRTNHGVLVRGRVRAPVPVTCSRCLMPFEAPVDAEVEEELSLDPVAEAGGGELNAGDFVAWIGPSHEVDLAEIVRQDLQANMPMAPLHARDCRGLCPVCGANWNERECEHYLAGERGEGRRERA
jgi:uncharacterized protein